jgi:hypothetical protein
MVRSDMELNQNTESAMQVASWFRQIAGRNFKQGRESLQKLANANRKIVDVFGDQISEFCNQSISLAEETLSNTFDCGVRLMRLKEPQELAQAQTDFVTRQARAYADRTSELNQRITKGAEALASSLNESVERKSKAA